MHSVRWFLLIATPSGLCLQFFFTKHCLVEIMVFLLCSFTEIVFSNSAASSVRNSLLHICSDSSSCHNVFILLSLSGVTNLSFSDSLVFVQLACWHTDVWRWSGGQLWRFSLFHRRRHYWCAHTSPPANFQYSHRVVLVPFCMICSLHQIAVSYLQAI